MAYDLSREKAHLGYICPTVGLTLNECIASAGTSGEMYGTNATYYQVTLDTCPVSV